MFFSQRMPLKEFLHNHYKPEMGYRLTLDTKDNTCVFASLEYIRVPSFKKCLPVEIGVFEEMMLSGKWSCADDSRFKSMYIYIIEEEVFFCDRDNIEIENFKEEYMNSSMSRRTKSSDYQEANV